MPKFKKYSRLYNSLLMLSVLVLLACGPGLYDDNEFQGFFMPSSGQTPQGGDAYYYSPAFIYTGFYDFWDREPDDTGDPVLEGWKKYLGVETGDSAAAALIFQGHDDTGSPLWKAMQQKPPAWNYLLVARKIENATASGGTVWEPTPADTAAMKRLYALVRGRMVTETDPFLRDKYAFQSIKLAHLLQHPDTCIGLYDHYFGQRTDPSVMRYWSLSHKGGALLDLGDPARGVYVFAQVFDQCPSRRKAAYMSLRLRGLRFIPGALSFCKSDRERLAVYTLCGIQPWVDALPLMEAMAKIDPNCAYLELIMGREINKNEDAYFLQSRDSWYRDTAGMAARHRESSGYFDRLGRFADHCAADPRISDPAFWHTAAAYISYVRKDYPAANRSLSQAEADSTENATLKQQIMLQKLLLTTDETPEVSPSLEKKVWPILAALKNTTSFYMGNAVVRAAEHLALKYKKAADERHGSGNDGWRCNRPRSRHERFALAKSFLLTMVTAYQMNDSSASFISNNDQYRIEDTTSEATLDSAIHFFSQVDPSAEDRALMKLSGLDLNYFYLVKGRRSLALFHYGAAAEAWGHVADSIWHQYPFGYYFAANPFATGILDTHAPTRNDTVRYTPYAFVRRMEQLSEAVRTDPRHKAENYYLLGCGAYNISYYGNSWVLVRRYWSSGAMYYDVGPSMNPVDSLNYYSTRQARAYFDSAMHTATDQELAARACFMAAKCEQKAFYIEASRTGNLDVYSGWSRRHSDTEEKDPVVTALHHLEDSGYHHYFRLLRDQYRTSDFTKEVIGECATYADFAGGR